MEMAEEEHQHRRWLTDLYAKKFGDYIPLIRRSDIQGFVRHKPAWTIGKMNIEEMRQRAEVIELENYRFYKQAAERSQDPQVKKLLLDLAEAEKGHESIAVKLGTTQLTADAKIEEGEAKRRLYGHRGGFRRALGDLLDPLQVHGYALLKAAFQIAVGGFLVFLTGMLIGSA
jgi:rubrerythrin